MAFKWTDREQADESFENVDLSDSCLSHCHFVRCSFRGVRLIEAVTEGSSFDHCDFTGALLGGSVHRASAFLSCKFALAGLFSARFENCKMVGSDFEGAHLTGVEIREGDWSYTNLQRLNLKGLKLRAVRLVEANLAECNLEKADLRKSDLTGATLTLARLTGADLRGAVTGRVDLLSLNLTRVRLDVSHSVQIARALGARVEFDDEERGESA